MKRCIKFRVYRLLVFCSIPVLSSALVIPQAHADRVFPLSTLREQMAENCWAYAAAQMTEARVQFRDRTSAALDIEKSYYYWLIHDRLVNSYARKQKSDDLLSEGGFSADLWSMLAAHGMETFHVNAHPAMPDFTFPRKSPFLIKTKLHQAKILNTASILNLEDELVNGSLSPDSAQAKITATLRDSFQFEKPFRPLTGWGQTQVPTTEIFGKFLGSEGTSANDFLLITSDLIQDNPELDLKWVHYNDDRHLAFGMKDTNRILEIARASMDRGWPVTFETTDHVTTALGYRTSHIEGKALYFYAVSDSSGAYFPKGLSWQSEENVLKVVTDITVFKPIVADFLPNAPAHKSIIKSVRINRRKL